MAQLVIANLITGADGCTTVEGRSFGLSSPEDRRRFHLLRERAESILIGGNTARQEPYLKTPLPLYILSRGAIPSQVRANPNAHVLNSPLSDALGLIEGTVLIEAGPSLVREGLVNTLIDEFHLTVTKQRSGENCVDIAELIGGYYEKRREVIGDDTFIVYEVLAK